MKITFTKSFTKSLEHSIEKERVKKSIEELIGAFEAGLKPEGLGLKKLKYDFWEIRAGLKTRTLFILVSGEVRFVLVGGHDEIRNYLKNI